MHLERFGLTWSLMESTSGSLAADRMKDILDCIEDDYFPLNLRHPTASALLTWCTIAPESLRNQVFDKFFYKTLQIIRFDLIAPALPTLPTSSNVGLNNLFAASPTASHNRNRPSHFLSLWVQKHANSNHEFRLRIAPEILSIIQSVVDKKVILSDAPLNGETAEADETVRAEIVRVLIRTLPHDAQSLYDALSDEDDRRAIPLLVALDDLAGDRCNSVGDEAADLVKILAENKDGDALALQQDAMVTMLRRGRGQVLDIMKNYSHFFESQSHEFAASLGKLLPNVGFASAAKWLEDLAERDPGALVPHIGALIDRLHQEVAEDQAKIMRLVLSVGLVEPQGLLASVRQAAEQCLATMKTQADSSYFAVLVPLIKVLAAVGTWSEAAAMQCMSAAALVARSLVSDAVQGAAEGPGAGLPPTPTAAAPPREATLSPQSLSPSKRVPQSDAQSLPPAATEDAMTASQSSFSGSARHNSLALDVERKEVELALLELFNLLKDKCSYCNLLSKPTLAAIASMRDVDAALVDNLLDWNSGKRARRGDRRMLLLHAGELYVMRHPEVRRQLQQEAPKSWLSYLSPSKSTASAARSAASERSPSKAASHQIAPSPQSMTLALAQSPQPPPATTGATSTSRRAQALQGGRLDDAVSPSYPQQSLAVGNDLAAPRRLFDDNVSVASAQTASEAPALSFAEFLARQQQQPQQSSPAALSATAPPPSVKAVAPDFLAPMAFGASPAATGASARPPPGPVAASSRLADAAPSGASARPAASPSASPSVKGSAGKSAPPSPSEPSSPGGGKVAQTGGLLRWLTSPLRRKKAAAATPSVPAIDEAAETETTDSLPPPTSSRIAPSPAGRSAREFAASAASARPGLDGAGAFGGIRGSFAPAAATGVASDLPPALQEFSLTSSGPVGGPVGGGLPAMLFTPIAYSTRQ